MWNDLRKYGRKSNSEKKYEKYGRKLSWKMKRFGKWRRNVSWIVKR
jgi:hypothetical protein